MTCARLYLNTWSYFLTASKRKLLLPATHFAMVLCSQTLQSICGLDLAISPNPPCKTSSGRLTKCFAFHLRDLFPLLQIFFCNFLATTWIPCQLYSNFIVSCIVGALYTFNHLFSLSGSYFVCFSFSLFFFAFRALLRVPFHFCIICPTLASLRCYTFCFTPCSGRTTREKKNLVCETSSTMLNYA